MDPQPLLTGKPIICRRCMHGHMVETITGRANTPVEYHCGFCGNYAIVGVPAKWPFMEVVKAESSKPLESGSGSHAVVDEKRAASQGSSPMQVGESLVKPRAPRARQFTKPAQRAVITKEKSVEQCKPKEESMFIKCKHPGCDKRGAVAGYCNNHKKIPRSWRKG